MSDALKEANRQWEELINTPLWELEDFPNAGHLLTLATEFRIAPHLYVYQRGPEDWVITNGILLRSHDGEWEVADTTEAYIARTRHKFIEAMQIAIALPVSEPDDEIRCSFFKYLHEVPPRKA